MSLKSHFLASAQFQLHRSGKLAREVINADNGGMRPEENELQVDKALLEILHKCNSMRQTC